MSEGEGFDYTWALENGTADVAVTPVLKGKVTSLIIFYKPSCYKKIFPIFLQKFAKYLKKYIYGYFLQFYSILSSPLPAVPTVVPKYG